jgi:hypothetical protein
MANDELVAALMDNKLEVLQLVYRFPVFCRYFLTWKVVKVKIGVIGSKLVSIWSASLKGH